MRIAFSGTLGISPNDVGISAEGSLIYAAGIWSDPYLPAVPNAGDLRIYSAVTGQLVNTINIGTRLGAMDMSPDGKFLMITELASAAGTATVYKVDLASGAVQTFNFTPTSPENGPFYDIAVLSDGTALMTLNFSGSGIAQLKILDPATGAFANGPGVGQNSFLSASTDGSEVLIGYANRSDAPIEMYGPGRGITAYHGAYNDGVINFNLGIQALNQNSGMVAQYAANNGLHIYDENLHYQLNLTSIYPQWFVEGVTFDSTGEYLFVLDDSARAIVQLSTLNWAVVQTIDVGQGVLSNTDFGGRLMVAPDGSYLTVVTQGGLLMVDHPSITPALGTTVGDDTINGTPGTDVIDGLAGNDTIDGGAGRDVLRGGAGNDVISGGDGDDAINGGPGDDIIDGGTGNDTVSYADAPSGVTVNLSITAAQNTGSAGVDTLTSVENLYGSAFGDTLIGDSGANIIRGQAGNDILVGGAGNDELNGGAGFDAFDCSREGGTGDVYVNLGPGSVVGPNGKIVDAYQGRDSYGNFDSLNSIEHIITGAGNDTVLGSGGAERIETGAGNDFLNGRGGGDTLAGGTGNDIYVVYAGDTVIELAGEGTDQIQTALAGYSLAGVPNVENLRGTAASGQSLTGNDLNNWIVGGSGNDTLVGGLGNDRLSGGFGNDVLTGGAGEDSFIGSAAGLNGDTITDFSRGDRIVITDATLAGFTYLLTGNVLTFTGGSLTLSNLQNATTAASAAPEGGVQITFSSPPIVVSAGVAVSITNNASASSLSTEAADWMAPTKQLLAKSDFHHDHGDGWLLADDANRWEALHLSQDHLFGLA